MALTYQEKIDKLKLDRSLAINAYNAVVDARADALSEDQYNNFYLHGDSVYIGINDLIWYHLKERQLTGGVIYDRPALGDTHDTWSYNWDVLMQLALSPSGDGVWGLYPPNEDGVGDSAISLESMYLNLNGGDTIPSPLEGLMGYLQDASDWAGDSATGDSYNSGDSYTTTGEAESAAKIHLYNTDTGYGSHYNTALLGTGLLGRRTSNVNIATEVGEVDYVYVIGYGSAVDDSDFYLDSTADPNNFLGNINYKYNFLTALSNIVTYGDSQSEYQKILRGLQANLRIIQGLDGDTNSFFRDTGMNLEIGDSADNITPILSLLGTMIGDSGDTWPGDTNFWAFYNYFGDTVGVDPSEANFGTGLTTVAAYGDSLKSFLNTRFVDLENRGDSAILGDTHVSGDTTFTKERKWRLFWLKSRVAKPKSSRSDYLALLKAVTSASSQVTEWNNELDVLIGDSDAHRLTFIKTPTIYAAYYDPNTDQDDGHVIQGKVTMVYDGQQHATHYWIYRQDVPTHGASNITNDQWSNTYHSWTQGDTDPENGFIRNRYTFYDTYGDPIGDSFAGDSTFAGAKKYVHRVRVFDTTNTVSGDTTASEQSNIFDTTTAKSFTATIGDSILSFGDSHTFANGSYIVINNTTNSNGYYQITRVGDTSINIWPSITGETTGTVYTTSSVVIMRIEV